MSDGGGQPGHSTDPPVHPSPGTSAITPVVEFRGISKSFPGQRAVDDVSFAVLPGEIHGLVGENGAGKSTLIKILAGNLMADAGVILLSGNPLRVAHAHDATRLGIGVIHQEAALFTGLSVAENLAIGTRFQTTAWGTVDWPRQIAFVRPILSRVGLEIDPRVRLADLTIHQRQLVALARVLLQDARVVVLDEVTAPLTRSEVDRLFAILRELRSSGVATIYVSHRLHEIFELADRVTVLRNGRWVATHDVADLSPGGLTRLIIGSDPRTRFQPIGERSDGDLVLSVRQLWDDVLSDVSFDLRRGEVLGIAGLAGAGRTNIVETIFGLRRPTHGSIELENRMLRPGRPAEAVASGIGIVTEDRKTNGYIPVFSVVENLSLPWLRHFTRRGLIQLSAERAAARSIVEEFDVRTQSVDLRITQLSGGNQQKAILARWLSQPIKVMLLDEPTHGVDIGAKARIYEIIRRMAMQGVSTIVISSELEELVGLCERVLLLAGGRVVGELRGDDIDKTRMLELLYEAMSEATGAA